MVNKEKIENVHRKSDIARGNAIFDNRKNFVGNVCWCSFLMISVWLWISYLHIDFSFLFFITYRKPWIFIKITSFRFRQGKVFHIFNILDLKHFSFFVFTLIDIENTITRSGLLLIRFESFEQFNINATLSRRYDLSFFQSDDSSYSPFPSETKYRKAQICRLESTAWKKLIFSILINTNISREIKSQLVHTQLLINNREQQRVQCRM